MYPLDRSLKQHSMDEVNENSGAFINSKKLQHIFTSLNRWLHRLSNMVGPKAMPLVPKDHLCYNQVLLAYRLKGDNNLSLRMLKVSMAIPAISSYISLLNHIFMSNRPFLVATVKLFIRKQFLILPRKYRSGLISLSIDHL